MAWLAQGGLVAVDQEEVAAAVDAVVEVVGVAFEEQPLEIKLHIGMLLIPSSFDLINSFIFKSYLLDRYFRSSLVSCRYQDKQCIQFLHLNQQSPVEAWLCPYFARSWTPQVEFAKTFALNVGRLALD